MLTPLIPPYYYCLAGTPLAGALAQANNLLHLYSRTRYNTVQHRIPVNTHLFRSDCRLAGTLLLVGSTGYRCSLPCCSLGLGWNTARTGNRQSDCSLTGSLLVLGAVTVDLLQSDSIAFLWENCWHWHSDLLRSDCRLAAGAEFFYI